VSASASGTLSGGGDDGGDVCAEHLRTCVYSLVVRSGICGAGEAALNYCLIAGRTLLVSVAAVVDGPGCR